VTQHQNTGHEGDGLKVKDVILVVDHGALGVALAIKKTIISPTDIRRLAEARGRIEQAILFTDEQRLYRGIHAMTTNVDVMRNNRVKEWTSVGFEISLCPRGPRDDGEEDLKKETIDSYLMEGVRRLARMCKGRERDVRFIFVISDEDYLPITRTLHDVGFSITAFITSECAFMDPMQTPHIEDRLLLFQQGEKGSELHKINTLIHQTFGTMRSVYTLDTRQHQIMDRFTSSEAVCARCGNKVVIGDWNAHKRHCADNAASLLQSSDVSLQHPYLLTESDIQMIVYHLETLGPKGLLEWVLVQKTFGTLPVILRMILSRMRTIPWDAIEVALGVHALGKDPMEVEEAKDTLTERALQLGYELNIIHDDGDEVCVRENIFEGLAVFLEEAEARSCREHIARAVNAPDEGALTEKEIRRRVFERPLTKQLSIIMETLPRENTPDIVVSLKRLSANEILYWLTDRKHGDRTAHEIKAIAEIFKQDPNSATAVWVRTLHSISLNFSRDHAELEAADKIAEFAGSHMTAEAMSILIQSGVLRHYPEKRTCTRGNPSHRAFTSFKHLCEAA